QGGPAPWRPVDSCGSWGLSGVSDSTSRRILEGSGSMSGGDVDNLLTPAEVAALFRVDPKTVTRWAKAGKISSIRTLGGHRRFRKDEIMSLLQEQTAE